MNGTLLFFLIFASVVFLGWLITRILKLIKQARKYNKLKPELDNLNSLREKLDQKEHDWEDKVKYDKSVIEYTASEKSKGFPWLAKAYDDYYYLQDIKLSDQLKYKSHPAQKSAEVVRQISKERREAEKAAREAKYLLDYCIGLAPWLDEYIGIEADELDRTIKEIHSAWQKKEQEFDEEVKHHFGPKYENLNATEKLQKKLDWWWQKPNKTDWQIGREYERYIGYLYEINGWDVYYHGKMGFEDLGRDLICKKGNSTEIIQCKRWAQEKEIHEKHIYYLFGTTVEYYLEHSGNTNPLQLGFFPDIIKNRSVTPKLIATVKVSPKAEQVAKVLGVVIEKTPFMLYPSVKCNISRRTGEKIYHLPFDQQYDTILIEEEKQECYVETVAEAETLGFRHAFHWKGEIETT